MRHSGCTETPELIFNPERLVCDRWEAHLQPGEAHLRQVRSSSLCSWHKHEFRLVLVSSTNFVWFLKQERISFLFRLFLDTRMNFVFVSFDSRHKNEFRFFFFVSWHKVTRTKFVFVSFISWNKNEFRFCFFFYTRTNIVFVSFVSWRKNEFRFCFVCLMTQE